MTGESFFRHFANRMQQLIFKPKSNNEIERLFAAAFPGESYSSRESTRLVQKLREVCSSLEGGATEALPPQQPTSKLAKIKCIDVFLCQSITKLIQLVVQVVLAQ